MYHSTIYNPADAGRRNWPRIWKVPSPTLSQRKGYLDCFIILTPQISDINEHTVPRNGIRFSVTKKSALLSNHFVLCQATLADERASLNTENNSRSIRVLTALPRYVSSLFSCQRLHEATSASHSGCTLCSPSPRPWGININELAR